MNLKQLSRYGAKLYKEHGVTVDFAEAALRFSRDVMIEALKEGNEIDISMLGKFKLHDHNVKKIYDFEAGKQIDGFTFKTVKFYPSKFLKKLVRE